MQAQCSTCGLEGLPKKIGVFRFWATNLAARSFFRIAVNLDKALFIIFLVLPMSCSMIVGANDTEEDTDTDTDTGTGEQLDTDTTACPWTCKARLFGENDRFSCNRPWTGSPDEVLNRQRSCPGTDVCCQPWPGEPPALTVFCAGENVCEVMCSGMHADRGQICFGSNEWCCLPPTGAK